MSFLHIYLACRKVELKKHFNTEFSEHAQETKKNVSEHRK